MSPDIIIGLIGFAFVSSITPGPNNMMLMASGVNFGFRRTIPHMLGIGAGFTLMVLLIGLGLGQVFEAYPALYTLLRYAGALYLLWLAWGIARSGPVGDGTSRGSPMTFLGAAAFQWVNPKAWVMAVGAIATYLPAGSHVGSAISIAAIFGLVNLPCVSSWAAFGVALRRFLNKPRIIRIFNISMALLLVLSLWPIFSGFFR